MEPKPTNKQILQEVFRRNPSLRQHFGHLSGYFDPKVAQSLPSETPKNDSLEQKGSNSASSEKEIKGNKVEPVTEPTPIEINLEQPKVTVNVAQPETPDITVNVEKPDAPNIHVDAPIVNVPEQKAPEVHITMPSKETPTSIETEHNEWGRISKIIETYPSGVKTSTKDGNKWTIEDGRPETN